MNGLRCSQKEIKAVLDDLEAEAQDHHPERRSRRVPLRNCNFIVYRGVEEEPTIVVGRNLSRHGVGFLFGQYMAPGERIRIAPLDRPGQAWTDRAANVVRCRHITKMIHEIGAAFEEPLRDEPTAQDGKCLVHDRPCPYAAASNRQDESEPARDRTS